MPKIHTIWIYSECVCVCVVFVYYYMLILYDTNQLPLFVPFLSGMARGGA